MAPAKAIPWRSCRGTKADWTYAEVIHLARAWENNMPETARGLIDNKQWKGGPIITLHDTVAWSTVEKDATNNAVPFVRESVIRYGDRIPSGFFFTDVFLLLHKNLNERLLIPKNADETVLSLASAEAGKLKKVMQHLRAMWRGNPDGARHPLIAELKQHLSNKI